MPRKLHALIAAIAALLLSVSGGTAVAQKRVALVIGNGDYQNVARLSNPLKDASAVANLFKSAGFEWVKIRQDVGNLDFKRALREFMDAAQDADVAVVYYAGHGIQVRDMNYLIPVDAKLATEMDAEDEAVSLDRIVAAIEPAKRLRLVILDACRDNPFGRTMKRRVAMRALTGGLAKMEPTLGDTLIAYAAKAGSTAEDGDGENSPFAAALIKHLAVPGLDIRLAFGRVRDEVLKRTGNRQEPFVYGSLGGESIALVPAPAQAKSEASSDVKGDYELVERIGTKKAWEVFLSSHKDGLYAELARAQLAKLKQAEAKPAGSADSGQRVTLAAVEPAATPKPAAPSSEERRAWDRIKDSGDRDKLNDFIARYPASPLAETAKNRLDALDRAAREREEKGRAEREAAQRRDENAQLILSAQAELRRLGCFAGREDGKPGDATTQAVKRYLAQTGGSAKDAAVTEELLADLKTHKERVCPLTCARGEHAEGDRCVVDAKPQKPEKPEKPKATARQRDEKAKPERSRPERAAAKPAPSPAARSQAAAPAARQPARMMGVGF